MPSPQTRKAQPSPRPAYQDPQHEWDEESQEAFLDTQLRLATHAQRLNNFENNLDNLQRLFITLQADQRRQEKKQDIVNAIMAVFVVTFGMLAAALPFMSTRVSETQNPRPAIATAPQNTPPAPSVTGQIAPPPIVQPTPAPKLSVFQTQVQNRLKARNENIPSDWQSFFDREAKGETKAKLQVAAKFLKGEGVSADQDFAVDLIRSSGEAGDQESMMWLGAAYAGGNLGKKNLAESARWYEKAGKIGVTSAYRELGQLYETGLDGVPDLDKALLWYQRGASTGDVKAAEAIGRINSKRSPQPAPSSTSPAQASFIPAIVPNAQAQPLQPAVAQPVMAQKIQPAKPADAHAIYVPLTQAPPVTPSAMGATIPDADPGSDVKAIQRMLRALGYKIDRVDGEFGPTTAAAIKAYQRNKMTYPDGNPSAALMDALMRDIRMGE